MELVPRSDEGSRGPAFFGLCIALIVLASVAVLVRFWSRAVGQKGQFGWDDWFCLIALAFSNTFCGLGIAWARVGFGQHASEVSAEDLETGLKLLSGIYFIFNFAIGFVKTSALFFYSRVFRTDNKKFRIAIYVGHAFVCVWYVFLILNNALTCIPFKKEYDPSTPGHCAALFPGYLTTGLIDSLADLYILVLPLPILWKTNMRPKRKILVICAFVLGYSCLVLSVGRLVTILTVGHKLDEDITYNGVPVVLWAILESCIGVISICVPSWWHLWVRYEKQGFLSLFTSRDKGSRDQMLFAHYNRRRNGGPGSVFDRFRSVLNSTRNADTVGTQDKTDDASGEQDLDRADSGTAAISAMSSKSRMREGTETIA